MSIVNSIMQRKAGMPSVQAELANKPLTSGHLEASGGLRGHSVDHATYPWRVVGHPHGAWSVVDAKSEEWRRFSRNTDSENCRLAHKLARAMKEEFPSGTVPYFN